MASSNKLGLALSGGGARGAFQVGVYEVLAAHSLFADGPHVLSGASAGAINAALIAAGKDAAELRAFWHDLADDPPVDASVSFAREATEAANELRRQAGIRSTLHTGVDFVRRALRLRSATAALLELALIHRFDLAKQLLEAVRSTAMFETARLRARLVAAFGGETVKPVDGRVLAIQAVDTHAGTGIRYVTQSTQYTNTPSYEHVEAISVDMILASASIPVLFPAVEVGRRYAWDGGVLVNTPLAPLVDLGADKIVTVLVTEAADGRAPLANFGDAIERVTDTLLENTYNVDRKLMLERNRLAKSGAQTYRCVDLYEAIRPARSRRLTAGSYLDFNREAVDAMLEAGRTAARAWLAGGPKLDRLQDE